MEIIKNEIKEDVKEEISYKQIRVILSEQNKEIEEIKIYLKNIERILNEQHV